MWLCLYSKCSPQPLSIAISNQVPHIKNDTRIAGYPDQQLSGGEAGLLGSAFMGSYMLFAPFFAMLANYMPQSHVMALGTAGWVVAALGCCFAGNYPVMLLFRTLVGIGEASFTGLHVHLSLRPPCVCVCGEREHT